MAKDEGQAQAGKIMRALGYSVELVRRRQSKTCDLRCRNDVEHLSIEVKTSNPAEHDQAKIGRDELVSISKWSAPDGNLRRKLGYAANQIEDTIAASDPALRLIWLGMRGPGEITRASAWYCTLYGVRWFRIVRGPTPAGANVVPCFFAEAPWFAERREIAGVVAEVWGSVGVWVNPFFQEASGLRETRLHTVLRNSGGVFELPMSWARSPLYIAHAGAAARGEAAVRESLKRRYGITVKPHIVENSSTAWPGHEVGGWCPIPGLDRRVSIVQMLAQTHAKC